MSEEKTTNKPVKKNHWLMILGIIISAVWVAFIFNERAEDNKRIGKDAAEQIAYNSTYATFQKRLSSEIEKWARDACSFEAQNLGSAVKRGINFEEKECARQAVQDHRGSGYPNSIQLCTLVADAGSGLKLDIRKHDRPRSEMDVILDDLYSPVDKLLENLPCDVPVNTNTRVSSNEEPVSDNVIFLKALLPPIGLAVVLWCISAIFSRIRKSNFANTFLSTISTRVFRFGVAGLVIYEMWLGFWVIFSHDWHDSHDWPQDWLVPAVAVPVGVLLSYLTYRWAVVPNLKEAGKTHPGKELASAQPDVALNEARAAVGTSPPVSVAAVTGIPLVSPDKKSSRNYLIRHWRGEISLGVTYWVNGFLTVIVQSALVVILAQMQGNYSLRAMAVASIGVALFSITAWLWLVVGTWRSADRHVERGGSSQWAGAAKGMVVLSILGLAFKLPTNIVPYVNELALIASGNDPIGDVEIKVAANGRSVIIRGTLREGSAAKVQTILDAAPGATVLVLDSNGGRIAEAQQLALVVRTRNLDTYVEDLCASACTFVFLAGKNRAATPDARIGFHQPSFPGMDADAQRTMTQDMMDGYHTAGLPKSFLQRIGDTSPEDMWYPTRDELIASNVINSVPLMRKAAAIGLGVRSKQEVNQVVRGEPSEDPAPVASADINTQMINASQAGNLSAVTEAVKKGADVNARTSFGYSALSGASTNGHTAVVRFLLDKGVNVNERLRDGTNALDQASFGGHFATTELLLARGANPNFKKDSGFTPLISAALRGHLEIVKLLLDNGADVNEKTESGSTALHHAAFQNHADVIDLLLRRGANPEIRNVTGYTYKDLL